jgi:hypothetical protein
MGDTSGPASYLVRYAHLFILTGAFLASAGALFLLYKIGPAQLDAFGPTARLYFVGIKNGLTVATVMLFLSCVAGAFFSTPLTRLQHALERFYATLSSNKRNLLIFLMCILFSFAAHAGNILSGYFVTDDFTIANLNHSESFSKAVLTPYGNDHILPLLRTEMEVLGTNAPLFNAFIFLLFALTPFFVFLTFRRLEIGLLPFFVFLTIYSGATSWADMLTGYYAMSLYLQILSFFSAALWSYTAWSQSREKKYLLCLGIALTLALAVDLPAVWTIPSLFLLMPAIGWSQSRAGTWSVWHFLKENRPALLIVASVGLLFAAFWIYSFTIVQPGTFLSTLNAEGNALPIDAAADKKAESWRPIPLTENFVSFFSSGVSLPVVAPSIVKILTHPALHDRFAPIWPFIEFGILIFNLWFFWLVWKHSGSREKKLLLWLLSGILITILMVILARPNQSAIPDFDYRYAGAPFFFYAIFLTLAASLFLKEKKEYAVKVVLSVMIVLFATQQVFSFHALRLKEEATQRTAAILEMKDSLLVELERLGASTASSPLRVPNLSGGHIFQAMEGVSLADYVLFFKPDLPIQLIRSEAIPADPASNITITVSSLRASTSPEFKVALSVPGPIRSYYASPSRISYTISTTSETTSRSAERGDILIRNAAFDPEKLHTLSFTLETENVSGNLELDLLFKNDFGIESSTGTIRIDDYAPFTLVDGRRVYHLTTDLLQIYTYALSEKVSALTLRVPATKEASVSAAYIK